MPRNWPKGSLLAQESTGVLAEALEYAGDLMLIWRDGGLVQSVNRRGLGLLGWQKIEVERGDHRVEEALQETEHQAFRELMVPTARAEGVWSGESVLHSRQSVPMHVHLTVTWHAEENLFTAIARDITHRRNNEHQLRLALESSQRYERLVLLSSSLTATIRGGYFEHLSPSWAQVTGFSLQEIKRFPLLALIHGQDLVRSRDFMEQLRVSQQTLGLETRFCHRDGGYRWLAWQATYIEDEDLIYTVAHDVSEHRQAEQTALETSRAKSLFLANMSHEIRTPLNAVLGFTELLLGTKLDDSQTDMLDGARSAGQTLLALLNDLLDLSKIDAGKIELETTPFSPVTEVEKLLQVARLDADDRGLWLTFQVDPATPALVEGDALRFRQMVVNLLNNAIKFTAHGGVRLSLGPLPGGHGVCCSIEDTGIGIPASKLARIFEPFTQADASTTRKYGGTGLGLAISHQLAQRVGGTIEVESTEGVGTTFRLRLPMKELTAPLPSRRSQPTQMAEAQPRSLHLLIAEDHPVNATVLAKMVQKLGHTSTRVADGREAVEFVAHHKCDLILMDIHMPEMDGLEAARRIRATEAGRKIGIVAVTASTLKGDMERCYEAGMNDYLEKPVHLARLKAALDPYVNRE
jgi:PAS domain S-box-containing protein